MTVVVQPRRLHVRKTIFVASVLLALFVYTYLIRDPAGPANLVLSGDTMGTTYTIKIVDSQLSQRALRDLSGDISARLEDINRQMSTYQPDSEISRFNASSTTTPFEVSGDFIRVVHRALAISRDTDGAFDPTLGPLINLWGFGHADTPGQVPSPAELEQARAICGYPHLETAGTSGLRKHRAELQLNLSAIAKGYGVDVLSELLAERSLTNTYVEIGGELRVSGHNPQGTPWRIGIDTPIDHARPGQEIATILSLRDRAVATSGDYRNYYEDETGTRISHLIDPRTGAPVTHALASATVIATDCMTADAVATALMIMGPEEALAWVRNAPDLEATLIVRDPDGFQTRSSPGLTSMTLDSPGSPPPGS